MRVLIADTDPNIPKLLRYLLDDDGYKEAHDARTGAEALRLAALHRPDIVITELRFLDGPDGFQLCRKLKVHPTTGHALVLMLTAHCDAATRSRAARSGADAFLCKPFLPRELPAALEAGRTSASWP